MVLLATSRPPSSLWSSRYRQRASLLLPASSQMQAIRPQKHLRWHKHKHGQRCTREMVPWQHAADLLHRPHCLGEHASHRRSMCPVERTAGANIPYWTTLPILSHSWRPRRHHQTTSCGTVRSGLQEVLMQFSWGRSRPTEPATSHQLL